MENDMVPGFFLMEDVAFVRREKGEPGIAHLKKLIPHLDLNKLSPVRKYPLTDEVALIGAAAKVIYGDDSPDSWEKMGCHDFQTVCDSSLGKVLLSLFGKSFPDLVKNGTRLFAFFAPFATFTYSELNDRRADFTVANDPYPKEYYLGLFKAMLRMFSETGIITVIDKGNNIHAYHLEVV